MSSQALVLSRCCLHHLVVHLVSPKEGYGFDGCAHFPDLLPSDGNGWSWADIGLKMQHISSRFDGDKRFKQKCVDDAYEDDDDDAGT